MLEASHTMMSLRKLTPACTMGVEGSSRPSGERIQIPKISLEHKSLSIPSLAIIFPNTEV